MCNNLLQDIALSSRFRKEKFKGLVFNPLMEFDVEKTVSYWLEGAGYDVGVAEAMFQAGKYPYALFIGHLVPLQLFISKNFSVQGKGWYG